MGDPTKETLKNVQMMTNVLRIHATKRTFADSKADLANWEFWVKEITEYGQDKDKELSQLYMNTVIKLGVRGLVEGTSG